MQLFFFRKIKQNNNKNINIFLSIYICLVSKFTTIFLYLFSKYNVIIFETFPKEITIKVIFVSYISKFLFSYDKSMYKANFSSAYKMLIYTNFNCLFYFSIIL